MTLRPIKAKHSSIWKARRARLSNGRGHWGDFKPRFSLPRPNGKFSPFWANKKGKATMLILLSVTILFGADQLLRVAAPGPANHPSPIDPAKPLWYDPLQSANGWSCFGSTAGYNSGGPGLANFSFTPNGANSGLCIDQSPLSLSEANSHVLDIPITVQWVPGGGTIFPDFGFFLTRNNTLPTQTANWDPENGGGCGGCADKNVAFFYRVTSSPNNAQTTKQVYHVYTQRDPTQTILSGDVQCNTSTVFFCSDSTGYAGGGNLNWIPGTRWWYQVMLNFTGQNSNGGATSTLYTVSSYAPGFATIIWGTPGPTRSQPWLDTTSKYYFGIWEQALTNAKTLQFQGSPDPINGSPLAGTCIGNYPTCTPDSLSAYIYIPTVQAPTLDTGGFFGPIIRALISLGVFMLNAALQFVAFITPGLQTGFSFMVTFYRTLFDLLGNLIWPNSNLGTAIFNELANFVSWMVDSNNGLLAAFGNSTAIFGRFVDALKVTFPWLPTALAIALNLLTLAVNSVGEVITLVSLAMTLIVGGFAFYVIFFFFVYVGDDALGGVLGWMETMQWLIFNIGLAWTARISNYGLDIITAVIGIIPKPFVQMVAHQIPRIPIIETNARFVAPSFDFGEARAGNMFSYALWAIGLDFLAWYESRNPALPGSIGALVPSAVTPLLALNGMLPFLNLIVMVSWGACIAWMGTRALTLAGLDLFPDVGLTVGPGRKISSGPGGFKVSKGKKRFQGRTNKLVGERVKETEKEKKITEAFQEAARKNQEQVQVKKARETGERIAKEELARRQKAEPGAE